MLRMRTAESEDRFRRVLGSTRGRGQDARADMSGAAGHPAEGPRVRAECRTDDAVLRAEFDAGPALMAMTDEELLDLAGCGFANDYPADDVARLASVYSPAVEKLFHYLGGFSSEDPRAPGFECSLDAADAAAWVAQMRPRLTGRMP